MFWGMNNGQVDDWLSEIEKGGKPQLDRSAAFEKPPVILLFVMPPATLRSVSIVIK